MSEQFLLDCEPVFYDALFALGEYASRNQRVIYELAEENQAAIEDALGLDPGDLAIGDYWWPSKWQTMSEVSPYPRSGARFRGPNGLELSLYREWWEGGGSSVSIWLWIKPRRQLDALAEALVPVVKASAKAEEAVDSEVGSNGTIYVHLQIEPQDAVELAVPLQRVLDCYLSALREIGGVRRYLALPDREVSPAPS